MGALGAAGNGHVPELGGSLALRAHGKKHFIKMTAAWKGAKCLIQAGRGSGL